MIKTLASLFAIYHFTSAQAPPKWVLIPAVPAQTTTPPVVPPQPSQTQTPPITPPITPPVVVPPPIVEVPPIPSPTASPTTPTPTTPTPTTSPTTPSPTISPTTAIPTTTAAPTRPLLPPNQFYGAHDQICDFTYSPLRDAACRAAGQAGIEQYPGFMKCERGYDCCLCGTITCGNYNEGCNTFSAGDSGVKGVKDIRIIGRPESQGGAAINCIGTEACADSEIVAENVMQIDAAGALSMWNTVLTVNNPVADFSLDCSGTQACRGAKLEFVIEGPPPGYQCNPALIPSAVEWNGLKCSGVESCMNTEITVTNLGCHPIDIQQIECVHPSSCMNTKFNLFGDITLNNCDISNAQQVPFGLEKCFGQGQGYPQQPYQPYGPWVPV